MNIIKVKMNKAIKKRAFTLIEVTVVLAVIGIISVVLFPVMMSSTPNKNIMKFKKANSTIHTVVRELVSSNRYYKDNDLGIRYDGVLVDSESDPNAWASTYFCETFADLVSTKTVNCTAKSITATGSQGRVNMYTRTLDSFKSTIDTQCATAQSKNISPDFITTDNIEWYFLSRESFGSCLNYGDDDCYLDGGTAEECGGCEEYLFRTEIGNIYDMYQTICIDVDGASGPETFFGYGVRRDGRIITGARADEWLDKSITEE